ncbi:MAG: fructose-6-phosphate aldolase [Candidatus Marsarchaeota archaeon]|nr:fructose-6-phosphate aldolase [Candidatus Marsarchaeota archaeon]MCL5413458.1 fructose-6-phosphate aldolase [Candidatus Marsarchaeota archaeon]
MKFFIDSANLQLIKKFLYMGIVDGITTNPSLLAKEGANPIEQAKKILKLVPGPVSVEVVATDYEGMIKEAKAISQLAKNVVVKIPMTKDGIHAVKTLSMEGIKTNVTLVFSANQALIAAKAGATYVSPFVGRLDDMGNNGMEVVRDMVQIFRNYGIKTQVLVASIRHPIHILEAARLGADVATIPPDVLEKMFNHALTDAGLEKFLDDWKTLEKKYGDVFKT